MLDVSRPLVYLITKGECEAGNYADASRQVVDVVSAAVQCGIDLIQIREKKLTRKLLFELTRRAVEITRGSATRLLLNDRVDIAFAAGADGVQLTSTSIPAGVVRAHVPDDFVIGVSCHSADEVTSVAASGADFALYGPVFESPGKGDGVGLAELSKVCVATSGFPVIAIGGIAATNAHSAIDAGAAGVAAIRSLNDEGSMRKIIEGSHGQAS